MLQRLILLAAPCLAASALVVSGPITAHAVTGTTGACANGDQHTGNVHHSFTDSHRNCVTATGSGETAYLTDSNFNLINMFGSNDTVRDFSNNNSNTIQFDLGANGDTVTGFNSHGNNLEIQAGALNDYIILAGVADPGNLVVPAGVSNAVLEFTSTCTAAKTVPTADNGLGTRSAPIIVC